MWVCRRISFSGKNTPLPTPRHPTQRNKEALSVVTAFSSLSERPALIDSSLCDERKPSISSETTLPLENWDSINSPGYFVFALSRASYPSKFTGRETSNLRWSCPFTTHLHILPACLPAFHQSFRKIIKYLNIRPEVRVRLSFSKRGNERSLKTRQIVPVDCCEQHPMPPLIVPAA